MTVNPDGEAPSRGAPNILADLEWANVSTDRFGEGATSGQSLHRTQGGSFRCCDTMHHVLSGGGSDRAPVLHELGGVEVGHWPEGRLLQEETFDLAIGSGFVDGVHVTRARPELELRAGNPLG